MQVVDRGDPAQQLARRASKRADGHAVELVLGIRRQPVEAERLITKVQDDEIVSNGGELDAVDRHRSAPGAAGVGHPVTLPPTPTESPCERGRRVGRAIAAGLGHRASTAAARAAASSSLGTGWTCMVTPVSVDVQALTTYVPATLSCHVCFFESQSIQR